MSLASIAPMIASARGVEVAVGLIILTALVIATLMFVQLIRRERKLKEAVSRLRQYHTEEAFAEGFEDFNGWAEGHALLGHLWREFVETLVLPRESEPPRVGNVLPAEEAFPRQSVLNGVNLRFYASVPNMLTGMGILGTFIGLVAGISLAGHGLASPDIAQMKNSLARLLDGASLAFFTSIAGLGCSLVFSGLEKRRVNRIDQLIGQWCSSLDSVLHRITPESLAEETLREAQKQRAQLERFNTDLALQIASALDEKIAGRLAPQVDKLIEAVEGLRADQGESLKDSLSAIVDALTSQFQQAFTGAAGSEMQQLAQSLQQVAGKLEGSAGILNQGHVSLTEDLQSFSNGLRSDLQSFLGELSAQRVQEAKALDERLVNVQERTTGLLSKVEASFGKAGEELSNIAGAWRENLTSQNAKTSEHLEQMLSAVSGTLEQSLDKLVASAAILETTGQGLSTTMSDSSDRAARVLASSIERAEKLVEKTSGVIESAVESTSLLDAYVGNLKSVSQSLVITSRELELLPNRIIQSVAAFKEVTEPLLKAGQSLETAADTIGEEHSRMSSAFAEYQRRFEGVDRSAQEFFREINGGLESYTEHIRGFTTDLEQNLKEALSILSGAIREFGEAVEDLLDQRSATGSNDDSRPPRLA